MLLYIFPGACSMIPHVALEWIGKPYEAINARGINKTPEYLKMNPQGSVPLLVNGDFSISQNVAILKYLADLNPEVPLFGGGTVEEQATIWKWLIFCTADIHPAYGAIFATSRYVDTEEAQSVVKSNAKARLVGLYKVVDEYLKSQADAGCDFLGNEFSIADVYFYVMCRWAKGCDIAIDDLEYLQKHFARVEKNRYVKAVLKAEGVQELAS